MFAFSRAHRIHTPIIVGLAGPSKSGKTYSALRLASGMAAGGKIAMINTEGPRGHQYAGEFTYDACDLTEPFSTKRYEEAMKAATSMSPAVLIMDSMSHAHEGIGGMLDQHESELDRMAGKDYAKRERMTWAAWVRPKKDEADMINSMLQVPFHIILCFRAKEKVKIVKGQSPIDLGWRPIASDRIHFETAVTLILPPNSKGTPDLSQTGSELRSPFDTMITGKQIDETLGRRLAEWAKGDVKKPSTEVFSPPPPVSTDAENVPPPPSKEPIVPPTNTLKISDAQRKRVYAIAKGTGFSDDEIKGHLKGMGIEHTADILRSDYDSLCVWAAGEADAPTA